MLVSHDAADHFFGALGAFYSTIFGDAAIASALGLMGHTTGAAQDAAKPDGRSSAFLAIVLAGVILMIHLIYLYRVGSDQVMRRPTHSVKFADLLLPTLLASSYLTSAMLQVIYPDAAKVISVLLFILVYLVWAFHDLLEITLHREQMSTSERSRKQAWLAIDLGLAILLLVPLIEYLFYQTITFIDQKLPVPQ